MGKNKNKSKKNKQKNKKMPPNQNPKNEGSKHSHDHCGEDEEKDHGMNLSLELTDDLKHKNNMRSGNDESSNENVPNIEPSYDSTENKAKEDMEQCEKLLGIYDEIEEPIAEIQRQHEAERERVKDILKDKEYEELKKLNRKHKKNTKEVDSIFFDKRTNQTDKLRQLYDIVYKTINENQKFKEKEFEEQLKLDKARRENEIKLLSIEKQRKQKHMLHNLFQGLKERYIDACRSKDNAIRGQQDAKKEMTKAFEREIESVTTSYQDQLDIKSKYEVKKAELETLAEEYKILETKTKNEIEKKERRIHNLQDEINQKIDKELKSLMDTFNVEKSKYDKLTGEREQLNNMYKDLKDKFQKYYEISDGKITIYNTEIESLQNKQQSTLQQNKILHNEKDELLTNLSNMDETIASTQKKIETFQKLKADLEKQV